MMPEPGEYLVPMGHTYPTWFLRMFEADLDPPRHDVIITVHSFIFNDRVVSHAVINRSRGAAERR
jgi:hypothetical protein